MTLNPRAMARALGGRVSGRNVVALGPGHSRADRSLSIKIEPTAPDGFIVHPFAGDSPIECLDYVRARLGLGERDRRRRHPPRWRPPLSRRTMMRPTVRRSRCDFGAKHAIRGIRWSRAISPRAASRYRTMWLAT